MWVEKKKEEKHCTKIELVTAQKVQPYMYVEGKKDPMGGKTSVRTALHVHHLPDVPCGNVCVETSLVIKEI